MDPIQISSHEVRVFRALLIATDWMTSGEIARAAEVAPRTARAHALKLVRLGVADQAEVFPGHRYRVSEFAVKRNRAYTDRLVRAAAVLGLDLAVDERRARVERGERGERGDTR